MTSLYEKQIKLIALDMDGTLLNRDHTVSEANRVAIQAAMDKDIHVVLSTGRSLATCREHADSLNLTSYLVTVNGGEIWDKEKKLVERNSLKHEDIQLMWNLRNEYQTDFWAISTDKVWYEEFPEDIYAHEWLKFGFDISDGAVLKTVRAILAENDALEISNSNPSNLEVNAAGINKANGLKKVCSLLGITMDNVIAMGDSLNDYTMIREAGIGVAMGNAQEKVKKVADWVTATNDDDGVAVAIRKWVLKDDNDR